VFGFKDGMETVVAKGATVYVGRNDNPAFVGCEPLDEIASRICKAVGPSGKNKDYLYKLASAVKELAPESHDSHLMALVKLVRGIDAISDVT